MKKFPLKLTSPFNNPIPVNFNNPKVKKAIERMRREKKEMIKNQTPDRVKMFITFQKRAA